MSFIQGTMVRLSAELRNGDTGTLADSAEIVLKVRRPSGEIDTYDIDDISKDSVGKYHYDVDTDAEFGQWKYEWDSGGAKAVVERALLMIHPRIDMD